MMERNFDQAKAESFAEKMLSMLNNGGLALMISIGHRTGLPHPLMCRRIVCSSTRNALVELTLFTRTSAIKSSKSVPMPPSAPPSSWRLNLNEFTCFIDL